MSGASFALCCLAPASLRFLSLWWRLRWLMSHRLVRLGAGTAPGAEGALRTPRSGVGPAPVCKAQAQPHSLPRQPAATFTAGF